MTQKTDDTIDLILDTNLSFQECSVALKERLRSLAKSGTQKEKMDTTAQLAMAEMGLGNMKESERLVKSAEKYIMSYGAQKEKGYLLFLTAAFLSAQAKYEEGLRVILRAVHIFSSINIPIFEMRSLMLCARLCMRLNMNDEAMDYINKAIEITRMMNDKAQTVLCFYNLNDIKGHVVPQSEVIKNAEALVKYVHDNIDATPSILKANVYESAAFAHLKGGNLQKAKQYAGKAAEVRKVQTDISTILLPDSYNLWAAISAEENDEAAMLEYSEKSIKLCKEQNIVLGDMQANEIRFRYYLGHDRLKEAKKYLDRTAKCAPDEDNYLSMTILSKCYIDYYKKTGDTANELKYIRKNYEYQISAQQKVITHRIKHLNAIHELEIKEKENEIMKKELNIKTQELNLSNHYLQQRNELLSNLKESINSLKKENSQREVIFQTLFRKIDMAFNKEENEKNLFKEKFDKAHTDFIRSLSKEYPALSSTECRIGALLHSGFNTKEIATLLSTTERNIETHRLHIRKKMNLKRNDNLNLVLASIKF